MAYMFDGYQREVTGSMLLVEENFETSKNIQAEFLDEYKSLAIQSYKICDFSNNTNCVEFYYSPNTESTKIKDFWKKNYDEAISTQEDMNYDKDTKTLRKIVNLPLDINLFYTSTKKGTMFFLRGEQDVAK
jgi:hypothetical protein